jgi:hypothetical protein
MVSLVDEMGIDSDSGSSPTKKAKKAVTKPVAKKLAPAKKAAAAESHLSVNITPFNTSGTRLKRDCACADLSFFWRRLLEAQHGLV